MPEKKPQPKPPNDQGKTTKKRRPRLLSDQQKRFVDEYLVDCKGRAAAIRAGYSPRSAHTAAYNLMQNPLVKAAIRNGQAKIAKRNELSQDMVVQELRLLGFARMGDYVEVAESGRGLVPRFDNLSDEQLAAIQEYTTDEHPGSEGGDRRFKRVRFKLADKRAALVDLGRHLGMFKDRHEITGKDGGPITTDMTPEQVTARYLEIMRGD